MMAVITSAGKTSTVRMQGSISVSASIAQRSLALAGAGIAAMPESMVQADIDAGQLRRLLPGYRLPPIYFYGVYPGTMARRAKTRAFIHAYPVDAQDADLGRRWPRDASEGPLARERIDPLATVQQRRRPHPGSVSQAWLRMFDLGANRIGMVHSYRRSK